MRSYQSVLILKPDYDEPQVDEHLEKITGLIQGHGGSCLKVDKWGKKRLAYKVKKNRFGYYLNVYHTCENEQLSSLEKKYKLFDPIIKFLVIRLEDKELERAIKREEAEEKAAAVEASEDNNKSADDKSADDKSAVAEGDSK
ncbi:MAG: hypothetical protein NPINA01_27520 [Nitrospinaceae bacterium]|nr:MAG: hypothetical protein NPINA01_27520 [Nitrospinaceae bacterium]